MKLLVCGGRDFSDGYYLSRVLGAVHRKYGIDILIHGGARGADALAGDWALSSGVAVMCFPALWKAHGKAAGPLRNQQMIEAKPDAAVAFKGGRGTADMVRRLKENGIPVWEA